MAHDKPTIPIKASLNLANGISNDILHIIGQPKIQIEALRGFTSNVSILIKP